MFSGTTHTGLQEANAVGVLSLRRPERLVVSNHRCHGTSWRVAFNDALAAELMGRPPACAAGVAAANI